MFWILSSMESDLKVKNQKHIYSNQKHTANWIKISSAHSEGKYFMHWCVEEFIKKLHIILYLGKCLPPIYFCLFHPPCHWANFMSGQIQNKSLITKSIRKRIYYTFHCLGKFNTGWNCFSNVQGRKKRQSENNPWYSILFVLS